MSVFYLLPSRPLLGERFADYLGTLFPGLEWPSRAWSGLGDTLADVATRQPDVYVIYREELPEGEDTLAALADGFGATAGDEIIEIQPGSSGRDLTVQRRRIG